MRQNVPFRGLVVFSALAALASSAAPGRADILADVRASLERLPATKAVRGQVDIVRTETEHGKPKGGERRGRGTVEVGPAGVTLHFDPQSVPRARKAGAKKADDPVFLDASASVRLLDPADELRRLLDGAMLVSDRAETFEGKPVRTVVFHPVPDLDDEDRKSVKKFEETVTLRLDGGGLPVSLDRSTELKVSKFLISFSVTRKESKWFSLAQGRLVTTRSVERTHGSGLGQDSESRTVNIVTLL